MDEMDSIQLALTIATKRKCEVHHMDVKNEFLHGGLEEEIYMEQLQGYVQNASYLQTKEISLWPQAGT
jgi:hypothetical protein